MKRHLFALGAAALVCAGCCSHPEFTVVSFNTRHCAGMDGRLDLARTAEAVSRLQPRFAGLQEIDCKTRRVQGVDQPAELGRATGLTPNFAKAIDHAGGEYGNLTLTAGEPLSVFKTPLPGGERRVLIFTEFDDCVFGTTHLSVGNEKERIDSIALIREAMARYCKKPIILTGDWNATIDSEVLTLMQELFTVVSDTSGRTYHGGPDKGPSGTVDDFCIDYIAIDKPHADEYEVLARGIVDDRLTSDHAPIFVRLRKR